MIVFDTSAVIRLFERQQPDVEHVARRYREFAISVVTVGEYWRGIESATTTLAADIRRTALTGCLAVADVVAVNDAIAAAWGMLAARTSRKVSHNDLFIVATAAALKAPLCASDTQLLGVVDLRDDERF